ncbi:hypothetical protein [Undibacterium oligocarboniphilum]|uniref:Uncharacterized protein n=1 Tax=Undibacterium oligocarboniphilum TaxID=666702 RepID=A0A850QKZ7_9BURK|nr:hypothetical protein [Undibacterium oligocarboniphilum]MBC3869787.1 hypothetical protein [Undibacterium oligocarboniphilum]NVO77390.1 hypothetical protein [Undibacterium oligocarboniphilum]
MSNNVKSVYMTLAWVCLLAILFAQVEIQIEGPAGWGSNLPTWRIEKHWLLDIFWGGRAMTGYHAWVFPFIALFFHFPLVLLQTWSLRLQARIIACLIVFWIVEDSMWFVMNPAYGISRLQPALVPWHHHWLAGVPVDYWLGSIAALWLLRYSLPPAGSRENN